MTDLISREAVLEKIKVCKRTSGYIGIGEWISMDDYERFQKVLENLELNISSLPKIAPDGAECNKTSHEGCISVLVDDSAHEVKE